DHAVELVPDLHRLIPRAAGEANYREPFSRAKIAKIANVSVITPDSNRALLDIRPRLASEIPSEIGHVGSARRHFARSRCAKRGHSLAKPCEKRANGSPVFALSP